MEKTQERTDTKATGEANSLNKIMERMTRGTINIYIYIYINVYIKIIIINS